jgi:imidazolonepropionase-like amidohydrolase
VFASIGSTALYEDERLKYVDRQEREAWKQNPIVHIEIPEYVGARKRAFEEAVRVTRAGRATRVRFLAGTDSGGVPYLYCSLHDELALLVDAGFTPTQALQAATSYAAEFFGFKDSGTIEIGKRADLVLLAADPLADIQNTRKIEAVILAGRLFERSELDALLIGAENRAKNAARQYCRNSHAAWQ